MTNQASSLGDDRIAGTYNRKIGLGLGTSMPYQGHFPWITAQARQLLGINLVSLFLLLAHDGGRIDHQHFVTTYRQGATHPGRVRSNFEHEPQRRQIAEVLHHRLRARPNTIALHDITTENLDEAKDRPFGPHIQAYGLTNDHFTCR